MPPAYPAPVSYTHLLKTGETLIDLLEAICSAAPEVRFRLGSLQPQTITEDFCRRGSRLPNLCPQFHLSMQSGCDETLKRMNRKYDTARYMQSVGLLNQYFDHPAVTTDLITGFPEETEEEFSQTLDFIRQCGFAQTVSYTHLQWERGMPPTTPTPCPSRRCT